MNDEDAQMLDDQLAGLTPDGEIKRLREGLRKIQIKIHHWEHDVKRDFPLSPMDFTATAMYIDHLLEGKE